MRPWSWLRVASSKNTAHQVGPSKGHFHECYNQFWKACKVLQSLANPKDKGSNHIVPALA